MRVASCLKPSVELVSKAKAPGLISGLVLVLFLEYHMDSLLLFSLPCHPSLHLWPSAYFAEPTCCSSQGGKVSECLGQAVCWAGLNAFKAVGVYSQEVTSPGSTEGTIYYTGFFPEILEIPQAEIPSTRLRGPRRPL